MNGSVQIPIWAITLACACFTSLGGILIWAAKSYLDEVRLDMKEMKAQIVSMQVTIAKLSERLTIYNKEKEHVA